MDKQTMGPKNNRKSKLEKEMDNLSRQLKQKEIKPMEFAENFPVKVVRYSKADVVLSALAGYKEYFGAKEYKIIQNNSYLALEVVRDYVLMFLSNLEDGIEALTKNKSGKKALGLLIQRAANESMRIYPWLSEDRILRILR
ncbi:hypothetical protein [Leptospira noguchii]|uniref:Uncharacterized protein n=1 Tax=Leptospira noguchii TaxID=28182 RepID=M6V2R5_9LEPT|nr:hypothetical protein [Leptospira noguchii]EMO51717.1 hypothetical protein LEP1GSC172_2481 [Leptospira noguchii]